MISHIQNKCQLRRKLFDESWDDIPGNGPSCQRISSCPDDAENSREKVIFEVLQDEARRAMPMRSVLNTTINDEEFGSFNQTSSRRRGSNTTARTSMINPTTSNSARSIRFSRMIERVWHR